jgi:thymidylate synthase (FAD)
MKIIEPSYRILKMDTPDHIYKGVEAIGRTCYMSEARSPNPEFFVRKLVQRGHWSVIEHFGMTVQFVVDRGVSHEWVRHRLTSQTQSSTRYCNFSKDRFGNEIAVILPPFWHKEELRFKIWKKAMEDTERSYFDLLNAGAIPEQARTVLPNSLATTITTTANFRQWSLMLDLRTSNFAHPQIAEVMRPLLAEMKELLPAIFEDVGVVGR